MHGAGEYSLQFLLDSFVAIAAESADDEILEQATDLARVMTGARYGAAALVRDGKIAHFLHQGLTSAQVSALPHEPVGLGVLGAVIESRAVVRHEQLQDDPRSVGFPLHHVPMAAFLGVPIKFDDTMLGALFLTKPPGHGTFSEEHELFVLALASQTAIALEAARLLSEKDRINAELRAADQLKSDFVAMASHELRTPLTSIRTAASTLRRHHPRLSEQQRLGMLDVIDEQATRLVYLIDNLLTAAALDAGPAVTAREDVPVRTLVAEVVTELTADAPFVFPVRCPPDLLVSVDPSHLRRIVVNLVGNALKYGAEPYLLTVGPAGAGLEIRVSDGGDGVPEEFLPRLFERFSRAHVANGQSGTGLGLAIVDGLARASGGDVRYERNAPHGASFVVRLPSGAATDRG